METDEMLLAHIALSFLSVLFSVVFVVLSSVAALFSAAPLSAMMKPQKLTLLLKKPLHARQRGAFPQAGLYFTLDQPEVLIAAPLFGILPPVQVLKCIRTLDGAALLRHLSSFDLK